ncbi:MAG: acyl-CoA dehydrogenase family protein [Kofleriaceae bacterium]
MTEEHEALRGVVRRFVEREIKPHGEVWEREGKTPRELLKAMGKLGLFGVAVPKEHGGAGLGAFGLIVLAEELARSTFGGVTVTVMVHTGMASPHLLHAGSPAQIDRYLPAIVAGEKISAIVVSEPDAGSDVASIRTRAVRDGDHWVLNGSKTFISNGYYGDLYFVLARTDDTVKSSRGMSMFLVERDTPGLRIGRKLEKMGDFCSDTAEIHFESCRVPAANVLGEPNKGFYSVMHNFQRERLVLGAMSTGEARAAFDMTIDYLSQRKVFGAPLLEKQAIRHKLAALEAKLEAAKQLLYHAAWLFDHGHDCVRECSMVKALCPEVTNEVMYACQQLHGGMGYMREYPIERMVRDARLHAIGGGATEVMLDQIAKRWR